MKNTAIKSVAALASVIAASSACADLEYQTVQTVTFDTMNTSPGAVYVGSNDESVFAENWVVWQSSDGSADYGFSGATQFQVGTTGDSHAAKYGRLKIESGRYHEAAEWKSLIGYKGTGWLWMTGGELYIGNKLCVGVGANAGSIGYLNMDGGKLTVTNNLYIAQDNKSRGYMAVTNAEVEVTGDLIVCNSAGGEASLDIAGNAVVSANALYVSNASGGTGTLDMDGDSSVTVKAGTKIGAVNSTGIMTVKGGSFNPNWMVIGYGNPSYGKFVVDGGMVSFGETLYVNDGNNSTSIVEVTSGVMTNKIVYAGRNDGALAEITVNGGRMITTEDFYLGAGGNSTATLTIENGGYLQNGTETYGKWFKFGENGTGTRTINLNEGGTLAVCHFENYANGTTEINFNGGTLKQIFTDSNNCKYIIGSHDHTDDAVTINVLEKGGIIDTNGKNVYIKNVAIGGTGTLTITGGGTVTLEALPTCPILVEEGTLVCTAATTPANITLGKHGFLKYDLSGVHATTEDDVTTLPADQTLATGVTITLPVGDTIAEHVIILNDNSLAWLPAYENNVLTASVSTATPEITVWTGNNSTWYAPRSNNYATKYNDPGNWTSGIPGDETKIVVPFASEIYLDKTNGRFKAGDIELRTTGDVHFCARDSKNLRYLSFAPKSVSGDGRMLLGGTGIDISSSGPACTIDVPLRATLQHHYDGANWYAYTAYLSGSSSYPLTVNKSLSIPDGVPFEVRGDVVINGDIVVDGTLRFTTTQEIKAGLAGSGTIDGSFTTVAGATLKCGIDGTGVCTNVLTVTGTANMANAAIEIEGGESLADAAIGTEVVLFRASAISNWTKKTVTIGGKPWKVVVGEETIEETLYQTLKATRTKPGFMLVIQ